MLALVSSSEFVEIASRRKRASKDILYGAAVKVPLCVLTYRIVVRFGFPSKSLSTGRIQKSFKIEMVCGAAEIIRLQKFLYFFSNLNLFKTECSSATVDFVSIGQVSH